MKGNMKRLLSVSVVLLMCSAAAFAQNASILTVSVGDDQGSATYEMVYGNHVDATWGMTAEKDSLGEWNGQNIVEKESPPLPPGLGVVWRPSRSGVSWGIGYLKYDVKEWMDAAQVDTFRLYFANAQAPDADIIITWDVAALQARCTAATLRILGGDSYDMFAQNTVTIVDAGDMGMSQAYIYKTGSTAIDQVGTSVKQEKNVVPQEFRLYNNYPNPFNPTTTIKFDVLRSSSIEVSVFNILGQKVATLVSQDLAPGTYSTTWDATNSMNVKVSSGVYYVRMIARDRGIEQYSALHKLLFVK